MKTRNSAPSNIALIKYMGKLPGLDNKPTNGSLSYTLEHLRTTVEISEIQSQRDQWAPLIENGLSRLDLSQKGQDKFLKHFDFLKKSWGLQEKYFQILSANNFPSDCGLASSASSFAALTRVSSEHFQHIKKIQNGNDPNFLSQLSRKGSGSSCRSFFSPWALWKNEGAESISLNLKLNSSVILLEQGKKEVSSSEAHQRVLTSPRFKGRIERAELKLQDLIRSIEKEHWKESFAIIWDEFWDMHELFHTSQPGFAYMNKTCREILSHIETQWKKTGHGPWVTLDA
ncbi:MAG: diphosphomevalonate decarboxylase, partial [Bdellovibrionales bacterium]